MSSCISSEGVDIFWALPGPRSVKSLLSPVRRFMRVRNVGAFGVFLENVMRDDILEAAIVFGFACA